MTALLDGTWEVRLVERADVKDFIEKWHYSGSINGLKVSYSFGLYHDEVLVGGMIYGKLAMGGVAQKYGVTDDEILELRRLCLIDDTPRNAESFFIGKTLRWLKQNTAIKTIVSYADSNYGHSGVIYRATNFTHVGMTAPGRVIINSEGRKYHDKAIRTRYNGELKPFAQRLVNELESGTAHYVTQTPKHTYVMQLRK